jgi:hypothetical protein
MKRRPPSLSHLLPDNFVGEGLIDHGAHEIVHIRPPRAAPRHLIAVQGGESPRFLARVRCPGAATNGTASRRVSPSHARPSGAPLSGHARLVRSRATAATRASACTPAGPQLTRVRWHGLPASSRKRPPRVEIQRSRRSPPSFPCGNVRAKRLVERGGVCRQ